MGILNYKILQFFFFFSSNSLAKPCLLLGVKLKILYPKKPLRDKQIETGCPPFCFEVHGLGEMHLSPMLPHIFSLIALPSQSPGAGEVAQQLKPLP